jgi:hypothetical protein
VDRFALHAIEFSQFFGGGIERGLIGVFAVSRKAGLVPPE